MLAPPELLRSQPPDVLKKGCDRKLIGVGPCHVHAPHLYLGLPKPPCPKCGWASVDKGAVVTNGWCDAPLSLMVMLRMSS
jgi:hypothetical protein